MKIQTGMQQQTQASMTPLTDKREILNRVREDVQQTSQTKKAEENVLSQAGKDFVKENPSPDPKEGVVMSISEMGRRARENPTDRVMARDEDGSVVRKQEATAQEKQEKETASVQEAQPKNPREAVEAVAKKRDEEATKIQSPAQEKQEAIMKAKPEASTKEEDDAVQEVKSAVEKEAPKTPRDAIREVAEKAKPPVPGDELEDVSLEGTISLKEYQQQRAEKQAAESTGNDMLKVA